MKFLKIILGLFITAISVIIFFGTQEVMGLSLALGTIPINTIDTEGLHNAAGEIGTEIVEEDVATKITEVRPDDYPLDTMLRKIGTLKTDSEIRRFGQSILTQAAVQVQADVNTNFGRGGGVINVPVLAQDMVKMLIDDIYELKGIKNTAGETIHAKVVSRDPGAGVVRMIVINGDQGGSGALDFSVVPEQDPAVPNIAIPNDTNMYMISNAKAEKDAQTEPLSNLPETDYNNCQIYMAKIEEAIYTEMQKKKVNWGWVNYVADALYKFRYDLEKSKLIGKRAKLIDPDNTNRVILMAGGIEQFVGLNFFYNYNDLTGTSGGLNENLFAEWGEALTDVNGSNEKFFFVSPGLMTQLIKIRNVQRQIDASKTKIKYGFRVTEIDTGFNILNLALHKGLKQCGRNYEGVIVDSQNIRTVVFDPMHWRDLDLLTSGQSKVNARILEERSTIEIVNPKSHAWVYGIASTPNPGGAVVEV